MLNSAQNTHFAILFSEKPLRLMKNEKPLSVFHNKNRNAYKFHAFMMKNMPKNGELRLRTAWNKNILSKLETKEIK